MNHSELVIRKKDHVHLQVDSPDPSTLMELSERFEFYAPGYKFQPAFKARKWDGKIRLFNSRNKTIYAGLFPRICSFAKENGYGIRIEESDEYGSPAVHDAIDMSFIDDLSLTSRGNPIEPRDYQLSAIEYALSHRRGLLVSPTGSGKSLIIYIIARWYLLMHRRPVLIVVPTTSLVEQMISDFDDYSQKDSMFNARVDCHAIYSGQSKDVSNIPITVSTWQSIYEMPAKWFSQFGCIVGDEAHTFKAKSLRSVMGKMKETEYRIGTTGTLDGVETNELILEGLFGSTKWVTSSRDLMDQGVLADLRIKVLLLGYPKELRSKLKGIKYHEEIDFLTSYVPRTQFIRNLAVSLEGNTLILFQYVDKHGKPIFREVRDRCMEVDQDRKVFYVSGETDVDTREDIRNLTEKESNAIIVASMGCFSTGINIRNIHNIIFASPSKSQIRVLQSIGRGLRKSDDGRPTVVYDLADDLHVGSTHKNYTLNHSSERIKMYAKQRFKYTINEVKLS